ncbi:hypothetical protein CYMTET_31698, partial [Cymbomonas tetramitiformis]
VWTRLKEAKEKVDEATLARDQVLARESGLEKELALMRQKALDLQADCQQTLSAELKSLQEANAKELAAHQHEVDTLEEKVAVMESDLSLARRDIRTLEAEKATLQQAITSSHRADSDSEIRLMEAERSRDIAEERAASNQRAAQLAAQEWERERSHLVAVAQESEQRLQQSSSSETAYRSETRHLQERLDLVEKALRTSKREKTEGMVPERALRGASGDLASAMAQSLQREREQSQKEAEIQLHALAQRLEQVPEPRLKLGIKLHALAQRVEQVPEPRLKLEIQLHALAQRLEQAIETQRKSAEDSETMLASKDKMLAKYREEARQATLHLQKVAGEMQTAVEVADRRAKQAEAETKALRSSIEAFQEDALSWKQAEKSLVPRCEKAEKQVVALSAQAKELVKSEEELMKNRQELNAALDRSRLDQSRLDRKLQAANQKADQLRRQLETAHMSSLKSYPHVGSRKSQRTDATKKLPQVDIGGVQPKSDPDTDE